MGKFLKYTIIILAVLIIFSFTACGNRQVEENDKDNNVPVNTDFSESSNDESNPESEDNFNNENIESASETDSEGNPELTGIPVDGEIGFGQTPADTDKTGRAEETDETDELNKTEEKPAAGGIIEITREEAGLSTIPTLDFSEFDLNPCIQRLIKNPKSYSNEDYRLGLVYDEFIIVSERFSGNIIEDIKIGDKTEKVKEILGEPSSIMGDILFYKSTDYYIGFKGTDRIEQAVLGPKPEQYPGDILKIIMENCETIFYFSGEGYETDPEVRKLNGFFEFIGHIHGGGWYAYSLNGIYIEEFEGNCITVYNNFEGDLYRPEEDMYQFGTCFVDIDYTMDRMQSELNCYISLNNDFEEDGILSPGGKYISLYVWNHSESYYFIIRTMDNSTPDKYFFVPSFGDYYWLNDRYILYIDFFNDSPCILDIENDENIVAELVDIDGSALEIKSCKEGEIVILNNNENKEYRIYYTFDSKEDIHFSADKPEIVNEAD